MMWENLTEENCAVYECTSLITNALTINSGGRSPSVRRAELQSRSAQRRLNITPIQMNFDEENSNSSTSSTSSPVKPEMSPEDLSFYAGNSPQSSPRPCSISPCMEIGLLSPCRENESIEERHDIDYNSVDSGFSNNSRKCINFAEPMGLAPKRLNTPSPPKSSLSSSSSSLSQSSSTSSSTLQLLKILSPKSTSCFRSFNSLSSDSMESIDEDCMDLLDMESLDENTQLPTSFNTIISGNIKSSQTDNSNSMHSSNISSNRLPIFRRSVSMTDSNLNCNNKPSEPKTPEVLKTICENVSPFQAKCFDSGAKAFKRPEPPSICSPIQSKRYKQGAEQQQLQNKEISQNDKENKENSNDLPIVRPILRKSMSMNDAIIMNALARSSSEPDLIGDFSKPFCLPLMEGRHSDLKSISANTMAKLLMGEFQDSVASFKVIDCRYPYEFEGGHIRGAHNLYTHDQIMNELMNIKTEAPKVVPDGPMRNIIVFHCEFSSERGPKLSRFLRNHDRSRNESSYPALHYPEIYLLHGGYKEFYETYADLCEPISYRQMLDPSFNDEYRHFRAKAKSWNGDNKTVARSTNRLVKTKSRNLIY